MIKALLFDMDGLLLDTERMSEVAWKLASEHFHFSIDESLREKTRGVNLIRGKQVYCERFGDDFPFEEIMEWKNERFYEVMEKTGIPVKKGAKALLEYAKHHHLACALATSTYKDRVDRYRAHASEHVFDYFDVIVDGSMTTKSKPEPDIFLLAAEKVGVDIRECLVLEDSYNGIQAGINAQAKVIMVPDLMPPRQDLSDQIWAVCQDLNEVIKFIEKENR